MSAARSISARSEKADDLHNLYKNVAESLATAQSGLLVSKEAVALLAGKGRAWAVLGSHLRDISDLRFSFQERFAAITSEARAAELFEIESGKRHYF